LLQKIDKEAAATITFDEFLEMATPKVQNRDEKEEIMKVGQMDVFMDAGHLCVA